MTNASNSIPASDETLDMKRVDSRISARLDPLQSGLFRGFCASEGRTGKSVIAEAVEDLLEKYRAMRRVGRNPETGAVTIKPVGENWPPLFKELQRGRNS